MRDTGALISLKMTKASAVILRMIIISKYTKALKQEIKPIHFIQLKDEKNT